MKIFQMRVVFSLMCFSVSFSDAQTPLQKYIDTAVMNNPSLKVYQFQSDALEIHWSLRSQLTLPRRDTD